MSQDPAAQSLGQISADGQFRWDGLQWLPLAANYREPTPWTRPMQLISAALFALSAVTSIVTTVIFVNHDTMVRALKAQGVQIPSTTTLDDVANISLAITWGVVIFFTVGGIHSITLVATLFAVVLLCYGGGFGTMPSFVADYFGTKYMGLIYGWILLAWGVGGIVGPIFAAVVKDHTGSFREALPVIGVVLLVAAILPIVTRPPGEVSGRRGFFARPARAQ